MDEFEVGYEILEQLSNTNEDDWLSNIEGVKEVFDPETEKLLKQFKNCHMPLHSRGFFMYNIIIDTKL